MKIEERVEEWEKRIKIYQAQVQIPYNECRHYV